MFSANVEQINSIVMENNRPPTESSTPCTIVKAEIYDFQETGH